MAQSLPIDPLNASEMASYLFNPISQTVARASTSINLSGLTFYDVPPELFARIFEIGIQAFGISFLPPIALVCRSWADLVRNTPRLWGIFDLRRFKYWEISKVQNQMQKSKKAPLQVHMVLVHF